MANYDVFREANKSNPIAPKVYRTCVWSMCRDHNSQLALMGTDNESYKSADLLKEINHGVNYIRTKYNNNFDRVINLYLDYNQALINRGIFPALDLENTDYIDAHNVYDMLYTLGKPNETKEAAMVAEFMANNPLYSLVPPFTKGSITINDGFDAMYTVKEINPIDETVTIDVTFFDREFLIKNHPIPYIRYNVTASYDAKARTIKTNAEASYNILDMYTLITPKEMKWSKADRTAFNAVILRLVRLLEGDDHKMSSGCVYATMPTFFGAIAATNAILFAKQTHAHQRGTSNKVTPASVYDPEAQRTQSVHIIEKDQIMVRSFSEPQLGSSMRPMNYQVASWSCRGHVRHYKSGKVAYIPPHTKHRKCMEDVEDVEPKKQAIIIA